jgi:DNA-binding winged helix-turn-helix (wHTH) protein/TolB-like protein/Tfp pilus assembly protein PilF
MREPAERDAIYAFGPFRLDVARQELTRGDEPVPLTPKAFDTLRLLVEAAGAVVTKEALLAEVWRDRFVEESVLSQNVYTLRKVLAEGGGGGYILTVPRRGYRLGVDVERVPVQLGGSARTPADAAAAEEGRDPVATASTTTRSHQVPEPGGSSTPPFRRDEGVPAGDGKPGRAREVAPAPGRWSVRPRFAGTLLTLAALVLLGWALSAWRASRDRPLPIESLAVLPFLDLTPAGEGDMLELAMADALITRLSGLAELVVRPTSAVQELGGAGRDPLAMGERLDVDAVIEGSLQRAGDRLRVSLRLLRVRDGGTLWSGSFDTVTTDPFAVQDEISVQVAQALSLQLSGRPPARGNRGTDDAGAYQEYVRGRYFWNRRTEADLRKAMVHFHGALVRDAGFAAAHAGLADCWALLPLYGNAAPAYAFPRAAGEAREALDLDPDLAEAHTSLAYTQFQYEWSWAAAEEGFRRAMQLDPTYPTAVHWYAYLLSALGRHDEAVAHARLAQRLDPLSLVINADLGFVLYFARRHDEAVAQFERTLELDPRFPYARFGAALAYSAVGRHDDAVASATQAVELSRGSSLMKGTLGYVLAAGGRGEEARAVLRELEERGRETYVQSGAFAMVHAGLGERELALERLDEAREERSRLVVFLQVWPIYDALRDEQRFAELVRQVGLPAGRPPAVDQMGE